MSNVSDFHTDFSTIEKATWEIRKPLYVAVYHTHPLELSSSIEYRGETYFYILAL